jgi:mono/diheme cytochrome c family protein
MSTLGLKLKQASWGRRLVWLAGVLVALLLAIQFVPYGRAHDNPAVGSSPKWQGARTEQLFSSSCGDCHSNLTRWWWLSNVAPASWLIQSDVEGARKVFNVSEWNRPHQPELSEVVDQIKSGSMPPLKYTLLHPGARLSDAEKQTLADGLTATWAADPPGSGK